MKKYKWFIILINLIVVLVAFNWSVYKKEQTLATGKLVLLALAPVDPRSLLQGDYMRLRYAISSMTIKNKLRSGFVVVALNEDGIARLLRFQSSLKPLGDGELPIKFRCPNEWDMNIGAESYFFEEGKAKKLEQAKYGGLKVDGNGNSILIGLYDEQLKLIQP